MSVKLRLGIMMFFQYAHETVGENHSLPCPRPGDDLERSADGMFHRFLLDWIQ